MSSPSPDHGRVPSRRAIAAVTCVLLALTSRGWAAGEAGEDVFVRLVTSCEVGASEEQLERRAAALAGQPEAISGYLELLSSGRVPAGQEGAAQPLSSDQVRLLQETAPRFESRKVIAYVRKEHARHPEVPWRRAALGLLGLHATTEDLALFGELLLRSPQGEAIHGKLLPDFEDALIEVVGRHGWELRELRWLADEMEVLREPLIRIVGRAGDPEGLHWLASLLEDPDVGIVALQEIGRLGPRATPELAADLSRLVRPLLGASDSSLRRQALRAVSGLGDTGAIPALIGLLDPESPKGERQMAHSALGRISGLELPPQPHAWKQWYEKEQRWFAEERLAVLERLTAEEDAVVIMAVRELSERTLYRDRIAARLGPLVESHPSPAVRGQVCLALTRLNSQVANPYLTVALDDEDPSVRDKAHRALRSIAGLPLPPDREAWIQALGLSK